jgi:hypothetical protein
MFLHRLKRRGGGLAASRPSVDALGAAADQWFGGRSVG